jgi:hypothetical protein
VTDERDLHLAKQELRSSATEDEIQIDERAEHSRKAHRSIREVLAPGSNVTAAREPHLWKHNAASVTTDKGMHIDLRQGHPANACFSIQES